MWPFSESPARQLEVQFESVFDPVEEAHARVKVLKEQLDALDGEMKTFKTRHKITTDRFSRLLRAEAPFAEFGKIQLAWRILLRRRDGLVSEWHKALHQWASEKDRKILEGKNENKH